MQSWGHERCYLVKNVKMKLLFMGEHYQVNQTETTGMKSDVRI